jgi:hypothetical protein
MAAQCPGQRLRAFDAQPDATVLDGGYGPLGDPGQLCQFVLAQFLELAQDTQRLSGGDVDVLSGGEKVFHGHFLR